MRKVDMNIAKFFKKGEGDVVDLTRTPEKKRKADQLDTDTSPSPKKKFVSLATFKSWKYECIGYKSEKIDGMERVCEVWCKVCAKYTPSEKHGTAARNANSMISGNTNVQKHTVNTIL